MSNRSGDEENTYHVQNVSDSSGSNNSDNNLREQLNTYDTYNNFNRYHEANMEVRHFDDIYLEDSNDETNYSSRGEGYPDANKVNTFDGPRSYKYVRPVNENELEFVIEDFIDRVKEEDSFVSPWRQTPSCAFRLLFLRKRKHHRNGFETYFSAFIETVRKDDWVSDWGFYDVQYYIIIFNLIDYRRSFYKTDHFSFNHLNTDRGWHEFIDADQLSEPGLIHKDGHLVLRAGMYPYGSENYKNSKEGNYNSKMRTGFVGLKNHGATCYMNALLQLLYHINIFRNAVCMMVFNIEKTVGKQTLEFYKKKLIKKKKRKKALFQKERALERERALQHLDRLKKEGILIKNAEKRKITGEMESENGNELENENKMALLREIGEETLESGNAVGYENKQEKENESQKESEKKIDEKHIFTMKGQEEKTEQISNVLKGDVLHCKLEEAISDTAVPKNTDVRFNSAGVVITRKENGERGDNIKDPFAACESSSDPSIGTSRNGIQIFGNLNEPSLLDREMKERMLRDETRAMERRPFLLDAIQVKNECKSKQEDVFSKRVRELEMNRDRDENRVAYLPETNKDAANGNFLLNDRTEQEHLFDSVNSSSNINDGNVVGKDVSQLISYDSDDLENYSWDESLSDSNLSVLSLSSSSSSSFETCTSSSSCYYKKKRKKNRVTKSKEINYRNILLEEETERKNAPAVSLALQNLFYKLHTMRDAVSCKELIRSFGWDASDVFTQQDTHELLKLLLDKVEEQMKGTVVEGYVKKLFEGEVETYIECIDIEYKSLRKETYEDIQLDVQGCNNIYESLDKAIEAEILEGDNIYETDGFGKQRAKKGMRFLSFPNICIFLLKRFTFDLQKMETVKLNNHFEFYKELDLSKYCPGGGEYVLQAVSVHQGSMNSGHYYSFSYKHDENVWIKCDDEKIFRVSEYSVINDNFGGYDIVLDEDLYDFNIKERLKQRVKHYSAYMLVYVKKSLISSLIKECNPAVVNPQVVRRCKLEEIINRKRMELRQKILQYVKVKVYDKYSYVYKSFRDLPSEGIPALFSMKLDRNTSMWDVYKKLIKCIEKIYERKKKKRITKMCKQTNKKQKTLQMLDHCMNAEMTPTKKNISGCSEVAEKRKKIAQDATNPMLKSSDNLLNMSNNEYHAVIDRKDHETATEFLSAQEERNEAGDISGSGMDPNLIYVTHDHFSMDKPEMDNTCEAPMSVDANGANDAYRYVQKRKMETWNDINNHRSSESDSGKGVKTAKTEIERNGKTMWADCNKMNANMQGEKQENREEAKQREKIEVPHAEENEEKTKPKIKTSCVRQPNTKKEELNDLNKHEVLQESENQLSLSSNRKEDDNVQMIEQNLNNIKLEKSLAEEESENEEMLGYSFDSDSISSSQSCLTVIVNDLNVFPLKKKMKKKKKIKKKGRMANMYAKRMRNRSNSSSSDMPYNSSDSVESNDSDSSEEDGSPLHLTAFHLQARQFMPRHRRPFPSTFSDTSSNSISPCSNDDSSDDDSSQVSDLPPGLKYNDDHENSNNSNNSNRNNGIIGGMTGEEDSESACSDFTKVTRSFYLLVSNRDVYRYLSIPLKKYGNYRLWELLDKTNKESNDLFPTVEILYLPYQKKTKVSHRTKKGETRLVFFKYFDIFKQKSVSDSSLICLDIVNCNEHVKPRHLERRALQKIIIAMEKGYVTKYNYDYLVHHYKHSKALPPYPLRFKIFVEYNNYRHVVRSDKSLCSNKVIAGDILVFNFFCNDSMEAAKLSNYREGKRREDFELTSEYQTIYTAKANANMSLKILYKKMKLLNSLEKCGNCSYLVNNRDGTYYRVRVLTVQEEKELMEKEAKQMERTQQEINELEKNKIEQAESEKKETEELKENGKLYTEEVKNTTEATKGDLEVTGGRVDAMYISGKRNETLAKNAGEGDSGGTIINGKITNQNAFVSAAANKENIKADNKKIDAAFNYGMSESSSDASIYSSSDEENIHVRVPQEINGNITEMDGNKHEYIIRPEEQSSLITLSDLINFDQLNTLYVGNCSINEKDIKALYVYLEKNKNKYKHGYGYEHFEYAFSLVHKDSYEIIKLVNAHLARYMKDIMPVTEKTVEKTRFLCRDYQYPYYSPSSSDVVMEKETGINVNKKRKRPKKEKSMKKNIKLRATGKKGKKRKKMKKNKQNKCENEKEAENFCEFMNYSDGLPILNNGKVVLEKKGKKEKQNNCDRKASEYILKKGNQTQARAQAAPQDTSESESEKTEVEKIHNTKKKKINNNKGKLCNPLGGLENSLYENDEGKKKKQQEEKEIEEQTSDKQKQENYVDISSNDKDMEDNSKYLQGYMCSRMSDISYCSSARSCLTFTSETSDYYLDNFQEDRLDCEYLLEVFDHKKRQKQLKKLMKQKMKRKKTSRSREGKNGDSVDVGKVFVETNKIINENAEDKAVVALGVTQMGVATEIGVTVPLVEPQNKNATNQMLNAKDIGTVQEYVDPMANATNQMPLNNVKSKTFNCETTTNGPINSETMKEIPNVNGFVNAEYRENYSVENSIIMNNECQQKANINAQHMAHLKTNGLIHDIENCHAVGAGTGVAVGETKINPKFPGGDSDDGSNGDNKKNIFTRRKGNEEGDVSISSTRSFLEEEKKKRKDKIIKKLGGSKCEIEPVLPFYLICDFFDFIEHKMHVYKFRFKLYDPIYQLGKYRNCAGIFLKRKIKKHTLNYIDSFYKFYRREIDKIDIEIDVRGPTKRIFQHVCHKLNVDPARVLIYPFPPLLSPINYTPFNIDSVSCLVDVDNDAHSKGNRNILEPACFQYFYNKITAINDPFSLVEERTCCIAVLPLHYRYIFRSFVKRSTRHLFYIVQLFNAHAQVISAFCGHIAYRGDHNVHGRCLNLEEIIHKIGSEDLATSDDESEEGPSEYPETPSIGELSTVQDLINKIKVEMNPYLKKRGVDAKQRFRLSYICDTRIRYLKNEEPLVCVDFFKNRSISGMFVHPIRMEPDYTDLEKELLLRGQLKIVQVFHNAPIKAWVVFGFPFEVLVNPMDNMFEIKKRIKKKTLLPRCVFEKLSFFELEDDQRIWRSNDDVINWDKKDIAILIADHNCPSNSRNQRGMRIA